MAAKTMSFDREKDHGLVGTIEGDINTALTLTPGLVDIAADGEEMILVTKMVVLLATAKGRFGVLQEALGLSELTKVEELFEE